jgi:hypothetical protein
MKSAIHSHTGSVVIRSRDAPTTSKILFPITFSSGAFVYSEY